MWKSTSSSISRGCTAAGSSFSIRKTMMPAKILGSQSMSSLETRGSGGYIFGVTSLFNVWFYFAVLRLPKGVVHCWRLMHFGALTPQFLQHHSPTRGSLSPLLLLNPIGYIVSTVPWHALVFPQAHTIRLRVFFCWFISCVQLALVV